MKEYICVDDTYKSLDKDERKVFLKLISKSMRYTKANICREFSEKAETKIMEILEPIRKENWNITMDKPSNDIISAGNFMCDILEELLAEMESE